MSFATAKKYISLSAIEQRQSQAKSQFLNACQTTLDVYTYWQQFVLLEKDGSELQTTGIEFSVVNRELIDAVKGPLAQALDIIAGGTLLNGIVMTRKQLLKEIEDTEEHIVPFEKHEE